MKVDFEWHDEYDTGIEEIDVQHRRFLGIIRKAYENAEEEVTSEVGEKILDELEKYTRFHFRSEEELMELYGYPKLAEQKIEHRKIIVELDRRINDLTLKGGDVKGILFFLVKWFSGHTTYFDREMGGFITKRRGSV